MEATLQRKNLLPLRVAPIVKKDSTFIIYVSLSLIFAKTFSYAYALRYTYEMRMRTF